MRLWFVGGFVGGGGGGGGGVCISGLIGLEGFYCTVAFNHTHQRVKAKGSWGGTVCINYQSLY